MKTITKFIYFGFASVVLGCFTLSPTVRAVVPAPDGGYPGANTAEGTDALFDLSTGIANTAVGFNALHDTTDGTHNTAIGASALANNVHGSFNMAIGTDALRDNTANFNLAIGFRTLFQNTTGNHLTGIGAAALRNNATASDNTAIGADAMRENTTGENNTAIGSGALASSVAGDDNTAVGFNALNANVGGANVAVGESALAANTIGAVNTAVGSLALNSNTTGTENTAVGRRALQRLNGGHENTAIGWGAGASYTGTETNNICIGDQTSGIAGESNAIRIGTNSTSGGINVVNNGPAANAITIGAGNGSGGITVLETLVGSVISIGAALPAPPASSTFVGGIFNSIPVGGSHTVVVGPNGRLADFSASSRRFKKDIAPMDKASEGILALKPVTFHFKNDDTNYPQFGLVAEDVAQVNPDWITRGPQGEIYGVRYETIPVLLLNEFLKEHRKVQEQEATIALLKSTDGKQEATIAAQQKQIEALAAGLQRVSAQLELSKSAPQTVLNNQ